MMPTIQIQYGTLRLFYQFNNHYVCTLYVFIVCGEIVALDILVEAGAAASTADVHGAYPIHYAAQMCGGGGVLHQNGNGDGETDTRAGLNGLYSNKNLHMEEIQFAVFKCSFAPTDLP